MDIKRVKMYYMGGLPGESGSQFVSVRGAAYTVPPEGKYIEIPQYNAAVIVRRYPLSFTMDAKRASKAVGVPNNYQSPTPANLSVDQLEQLLEAARKRETKNKGSREVVEVYTGVDFEENNEEIVDPRPRSGRKVKRAEVELEVELEVPPLDISEINSDVEGV